MHLRPRRARLEQVRTRCRPSGLSGAWLGLRPQRDLNVGLRTKRSDHLGRAAHGEMHIVGDRLVGSTRANRALFRFRACFPERSGPHRRSTLAVVLTGPNHAGGHRHTRLSPAPRRFDDRLRRRREHCKSRNAAGYVVLVGARRVGPRSPMIHRDNARTIHPRSIASLAHPEG